MKSKFNGVILAAMFVASAVPALAQENVQISRDGRPERMFRPVSGINSADKMFLMNASIANIFEIRTSELATKKSNNSFVQEFAKEMIHEHTNAQNELKLVADKKGYRLPQNLPAKLQMAYAKLSRLSGSAFDREYQKWQKAGHEDTSMKFKSEIRKGHDQDVKGYAVKTLPAVKMHYTMLLTKKTMMGMNKMDHGM